MATTRTRKTKAGAEPEATAPAHEEIALRAYEIHTSGEGGDPVGNWLRAEQEILAERGLAAVAA